jgi:hypothetical protein
MVLVSGEQGSILHYILYICICVAAAELSACAMKIIGFSRVLDGFSVRIAR